MFLILRCSVPPEIMTGFCLPCFVRFYCTVDCKFAIEKDGKYIVDSLFLDYPLLITEIPKNLLGHWIFDEDNSSWTDDVEGVYPQENNMIEYCLAEVI